MFTTIGHQIFNGDNRHIVLLRKGHALRRARHGAIIIGQFTQHACGFETGQRDQIDGRFSVAATGQYAARLRAQGWRCPAARLFACAAARAAKVSPITVK